MATSQDNIPQVKTVRVEDIDQAIYDWLDVTVDAHVSDVNGERKKVSVLYASGERWKLSREKKGIRDNNGVLILPVISVKRIGIEPSARMSAPALEVAVMQVSRRIDPKTNNLKNLRKARKAQRRSSIMQPVIHEVTTIPFPDFSIMTYELIVQAQYIVHMNLILEKLFHSLDMQKSFAATLGEPRKQNNQNVHFEYREPENNDYVVGFFDQSINDTSNMEEFTDAERIVMYTTQITVPAYLQLDPEGNRPSTVKEYTSFKLELLDETVHTADSQEELDALFDHGDLSIFEK